MMSSLSVLDLVIIAFGLVLTLKRVADMTRYHTLRVVALTSFLGFIVIFLFLAYGFTLGNPNYSSDCLDFDHFCQSEM